MAQLPPRRRQQPDSLNAVMTDTIAHYNSIKPIYHDLVNAIHADKILDEMFIKKITSQMQFLIPNNEDLKNRTNEFRDQINRNADPDEIAALKGIDYTLRRGDTSLNAIKKVCEGIGALLDLGDFFNRSRMKNRNQSGRKGKKLASSS